MFTEKQISEIKNHLEKAQNPVFFFDNDLDGLCSFLLLQRYIGRGKGVAIKSFPELDENYFRKVDELSADYIFILDKPLVSEGFVERVREKNIPIVWIDHHSIDTEISDFADYYNPFLNKPSTNEPVTALCYQIVQKKEDLWIGVLGSVADYYLPEFYNEFSDKYPDLAIDTKDPFEVIYNSKIGEIAKILSNGLKDTITNVVIMLRFLLKTNSPYDILEENSKTHNLHKRSNQIDQKYQRLLGNAKAFGNGKLLFFRYSGDLSVSGELSNNLKYLFPKRIIVVVYVKDTRANLSLRGKNIKEVFLKAIQGLQGATGGGHDDAVGGQIQSKDLDKFKEKLEELI